jgi:phosphocarrier protein
VTERRLLVLDPSGLHARRAAEFVQLASRFGSRITIRYGEREADARSVVGILLLGVRPATEITLVAEGVDADDALAALTRELATSVRPADDLRQRATDPASSA